MMGKKIKSALLATSLIAGVAVSYMPTDAEACGCLPPAYASTVATSTGAISAGFGMLTLMISQSFGAINASLSAQQSTMAEVTSYQNSEYTQLARMEARHDITTNFTDGTDACIPYHGTTMTGPKSVGSLQARRQLSEANDLHLRNLTSTTSGTASANATATIEEMESRYCGIRSEMLGRCTFSGDREELRDAHIKPLMMKYDTLDDELVRAANDFAQMVAGPTPPPPVSADYTTPLGQTRLRDRVTRDARVDTMMETFEYLTGLKKEIGSGEGTPDGQWADNLREHTTGSSDRSADSSNTEADDQSLYEVMAMQNEYRFKSPDWVNGIMAGTPSELPILKQLAVMEATNLYTEWKRFELDQRIAANLAVILATKAEESYVRTE